MIETDPHTQVSNVQGEEGNSIAISLNYIHTRLLTMAYLLLDTLQFLLAPGEMLGRIEKEFDQQIYRRDDG